jgi:hypothetical protein
VGSASATVDLILDREPELERIDELLAQTRSGSCGVLVIEGRAGMGKTTLVAACASRARRHHVLLLSARGRELECGFGFGVVRQLFEPYLASYLPRWLDRVLPDLDIDGELLREDHAAAQTERAPLAAGAPA